LPYRVPFVLGNDLAGLVVRVGSAVRSYAPGDEVYARPGTDNIGTFAELAAVHEDDLARKPATQTMEESAALPLVALTAWQALVERANLQPGQKVLIHTGSGGVGTIAIQLARHLGAHVATTTGTANTEWIKNLGADVVIDYKRDDFEKVLRDYDVALDSLGGQTLEKSLRVLKPGGIAIGIVGPPDPAFAGEIGASPVVRLATALLNARTRLRARRRHVRYSFLFMKASGEQLRAIAALVDGRAIRPVIDRVFPFESVNDAMAGSRDPSDPAALTGPARRHGLAALPGIFAVGHVRSPMRAALGDGQVGHEVPGAGTMPVLFPVRSEDDVTGIELDDLLAPGLDQAAALSDVQGLAAVVGMPGGTGTGGEVPGGHVELRRRQPAGDGIDPHLTGERLGRPLGGRRLARDLHPFVLLPLVRAGRLTVTRPAPHDLAWCGRFAGEPGVPGTGRTSQAVRRAHSPGSRTTGAMRDFPASWRVV
jgi:NADPH:quinone reductase-like Zn-dependent oxidoreductase